MKLLKLKIKGYKSLQDTEVSFSMPPPEYANLHFLVGVNGSGKSVFLEATGLVFTRIMQDEAPGFPFELDYEINDAIVKVYSADKRASGYRLKVEIKENGSTNSFTTIPEAYRPRRLVSYTSGLQSRMDNVMHDSPRDSLASDLYDESMKSNPQEQAPHTFDDIMFHYDNFINNPRLLSLGVDTAKMILPILFSILPGHDLPDQERFCELREDITNRISSFEPLAFSMVVDPEKLDDMADKGQAHHKRLKELIEPESNVSDWQVMKTPIQIDEHVTQTEMVVGFMFEKHPKTGGIYHKALHNEFKDDPMFLLHILKRCYDSAAVRDIHFSYRLEGCPHILTLDAFSDGELMWIARMGLILLSRTQSAFNTLFLFDEPDAHFNDEWNMSFVSLIHKMSNGYNHFFVVATHSTLILTDAFHEQIHLFTNESNEGTKVEQAPISAFGALREEIAEKFFHATSTGTFSASEIERVLKVAQSLEEIKEWILRSGPGYQRFRLFERYYEIMEKHDKG